MVWAGGLACIGALPWRSLTKRCPDGGPLPDIRGSTRVTGNLKEKLPLGEGRPSGCELKRAWLKEGSNKGDDPEHLLVLGAGSTCSRKLTRCFLTPCLDECHWSPPSQLSRRPPQCATHHCPHQISHTPPSLCTGDYLHLLSPWQLHLPRELSLWALGQPLREVRPSLPPAPRLVLFQGKACWPCCGMLFCARLLTTLDWILVLWFQYFQCLLQNVAQSRSLKNLC